MPLPNYSVFDVHYTVRHDRERWCPNKFYLVSDMWGPYFKNERFYPPKDLIIPLFIEKF